MIFIPLVKHQRATSSILILPSLLAITLFSFLFLPHPALAFKIDTHLWVGQQVINDIEDDGNITLNLGPNNPISLPVPADIKDAILNNRNEFLIGNIGPDALPDVVVGQTVVHPGLGNKEGWDTNGWLKYLLRKSENSPLGKAFAYGYLGHAAADIFAHTYVNQYAGDIFLLTDGETLVEQRHAALEGFISEHNPPFLNVNGQDLGKPWTLVQPSDGLANFVRDNLIYTDEVLDQYSKAPGAKHLKAYHNYRKAITDAADSSIWLDIDKAVLKAVASYYGYDVSSEEAEALINFMNNEVIPKVQQHIDLTQEEINRLNATIDRYDALHQDAVTTTIRQIISLNSRILSLLADRAAADKEICQNIVENICYEPPHPPCGKWYAPWPCPPPVCNLINKTVCAIPEASVNLIQQIDAQLNGDNGLHNQLLQSVNQLHDQLVTLKNSTLDIHNRIVDLGQVLTNNTSPAKALLQSWTSDLDLAMTGYVKAAANTMIITMNTERAPGDALKPMIEWWDCYHLTLVGVPSAVGTGSCGFRGSVESVWSSLENIQNIIEDAALIAPANMAGLPSPAQVREEIERLKLNAIDAIKREAINQLMDILPSEVQDIINVFAEKMTADRLKYYFTKPEANVVAVPGDFVAKNLLMIETIDQRIIKEMHVTSKGKYDPQQFAAVYNAVVLAKLALLDSNGLASLAQQAGVQNSSAVFDGTPNILADAVASIDGNHQWLQEAPPYPSTTLTPLRTANKGVEHPSLGYASPAGFVPWRADVRDALFRRLFIGPLSPGIELPEQIGLLEILPTGYPYRPCFANPFPNYPLLESESQPADCPPPGPAPITSTMTLNASMLNAEVGTPLTLTAIVSGSAPTGKVTFFDNGLNIGVITLFGDSAIMTTSALRVGNHTITAQYSGDDNHFNSTSSSAVQVRINNPPPEFDECAWYRNRHMACP